MSDIKHFLLRLPTDMYAALELQAVQLNTSLNKLIVQKLSDASNVVPTYQKSAVRTRAVAAMLPKTFAGCDIPAPVVRKGHDVKNCRVYGCLMCKMEKESE